MPRTSSHCNPPGFAHIPPQAWLRYNCNFHSLRFGFGREVSDQLTAKCTAWAALRFWRINCDIAFPTVSVPYSPNNVYSSWKTGSDRVRQVLAHKSTIPQTNRRYTQNKISLRCIAKFTPSSWCCTKYCNYARFATLRVWNDRQMSGRWNFHHCYVCLSVTTPYRPVNNQSNQYVL